MSDIKISVLTKMTSVPSDVTTPEPNNDDNGPDNQNISGKHKSEVWDYFVKVEWTKERRTAKCTVSNCKHKPFSCGAGGTTKPLWRHLESTHRTLYVTTEEYHRKRRKTQETYGTVEEIFQKVIFNFFFFRFSD